MTVTIWTIAQALVAIAGFLSVIAAVAALQALFKRRLR